MPEPGKISELLDTIDDASPTGTEAKVSVREIVDAMGERSFVPVMLVAALIVASPASGIPILPTVGAVIIAIVAVQMVAGRDSLSLPGAIDRLSINSGHLKKAVALIRKPIGFVEPLLKPRLVTLTQPPARQVALVMCLLLTLVIPPLELLPFMSSIAALAIVFFAAGLLVRDGILMIIGYGWVAVGTLVAFRIL